MEAAATELGIKGNLVWNCRTTTCCEWACDSVMSRLNRDGCGVVIFFLDAKGWKLTIVMRQNGCEMTFYD